MTDFGSGIYLTNSEDIGPDWDLDTDETGDIRTVSGPDELQKDVSYATAVRLNGQIGARITPAVLNRIKSRVRDAFVDEERIDSIRVLSATVSDSNDTINVTAEVRANDETVELLFEVNR